MTYQRNRREGLAHRALLRTMLLPVQVGQRLPTAACLAAVLGIHESEASRHRRRVLVEAGVRTTAGRRGTFVAGMEGGA